MQAFQSLMSIFMTPQCYDEFFVELNFFNVPCLKAFISKVLGYGIILGAVLVKVPQIQKMVKSGSAAGMSFSSVLLELYAITSMLSYSIAREFPFSTWGDSFFLMIQTILISFLMQHYNGRTMIGLAFIVVYFCILFLLTSGLTSISILAALQASNMPAVVIAKLIQAIECVKNGHTGQLSAVTFFLLLLGSAARIFTSIQETGDPIVILNYVVSTFSNGIICFQLLWYWKATEEYLRKQKSD